MTKELDADIDSCLKTFLGAHRSTLNSLVMHEHYWLACGSTKTGIETALSRCSSFEDITPVVMDYHCQILHGKLAIGLTYSYNSTEVSDFIPANTQWNSKIITGNDNVNAAHVLQINIKKIPLRYLPLLTHKLVQSIYNEEISEFADLSDLEILFEPVFETLKFAYINNRIPLFTSDNNSWFARLFSEQYMECLKRPAFYMNYPNYTHNFMWSLSKHNIDKFCFIHENSQHDYSDNRQDKTRQYIKLLGGVQTELSLKTTDYDVYTIWSLCIMLYDKLGKSLGLNINTEYSFNKNSD